jgi:DNA polymerase-3 subunit alpha
MLSQFKPENYNGPSEFVHLHNHTVFSALDGVSTPEQYAEQCYERGYPAMSATEHGHMASVPDMYLAFREYGIKYIPGCEIYYNDWEPKRQNLEKQNIKVRSQLWRAENPLLSYRIARNRHLTILCKNQIGFHNLVKLTTRAYDIGKFGMGRMQFNRIWFDELCKFKEGLIVLSGCLNGPVSHELRFRELKNKEDEVIYERNRKDCLKDACAYIKKFKKAFGEDYFIELQMPGIPDDEKVFKDLVCLADHYKIPTVLANDCHYLKRDDFVLQKIMMAVAQNTTIDSPDLFHVNSDEQYMKSRAELWARYKNHYSDGFDDGVFETMCNNTLMIAEKCEPFEVDASPKIPEIENADEMLKKAVAVGLKERGLDKNQQKFVIDGREVTYVEQAKIEFNRFIDKGFASYFLITQDLVNYGRQRGWPFSPRGSAGGSLVCFLLGIHVLDPMVWGLSFDRFLSPSRGGYMLNTKMPEPVN